MGQRRPDDPVETKVEVPSARPLPASAAEELTGNLARGTEPRPLLDPAQELRELEVKLAACLAHLTMHFQPIVHGETRAHFASEALLRSKDKSLPHPGAILDAAERLEKVPVLGRAVRA